jgi:hypothetical protein
MIYETIPPKLDINAPLAPYIDYATGQIGTGMASWMTTAGIGKSPLHDIIKALMAETINDLKFPRNVLTYFTDSRRKNVIDLKIIADGYINTVFITTISLKGIEDFTETALTKTYEKAIQVLCTDKTTPIEIRYSNHNTRIIASIPEDSITSKVVLMLMALWLTIKAQADDDDMRHYKMCTHVKKRIAEPEPLQEAINAMQEYKTNKTAEKTLVELNSRNIKKEIETREQEIFRIQDDIRDLSDNVARLLQQKEDTNLILNALLETKTDERSSEIYDYIKASKTTTLILAKNDILIFTFVAPVRYWGTDEPESIAKGTFETQNKILSKLVNNRDKVELRLQESIVVDLKNRIWYNEFRSDIRTEFVKCIEKATQDLNVRHLLYNTHHSRHNCYDAYMFPMNEAVAKYDIIAFCETATMSLGSINLLESVATQNMTEALKQCKDAKIIWHKERQEYISPRELEEI